MGQCSQHCASQDDAETCVALAAMAHTMQFVAHSLDGVEEIFDKHGLVVLPGDFSDEMLAMIAQQVSRVGTRSYRGPGRASLNDWGNNMLEASPIIIEI